MKSTELRHNLILYNKNPAGFIKDGVATVDNIFKNEELSQWLDNQGFESLWQDGIFEKLAVNRQYYELEDAESLKQVRIWQLRSDFDFGGRFLSYEDMTSKYGAPNEADYVCAYDGDIGTNDLEEIYTKCNMDHPEGYKGHSLSMSDVVELYDEDTANYHYVDRFGFKEIEFAKQEPIQDMEMEMQSM